MNYYELLWDLMVFNTLFFQKGFDYTNMFVKWGVNRLKIPLKSTFSRSII